MADPNMSEPEGLPEGASELFAADPDRFVEARDRLAKELKTRGAPAEAAAVRRLRKPTLAVWGINRAVRARPDVAKELLNAGRAMAAAGSGVELRKGSAARQAAIRALVEEAARQLEGGGHGSSGSVVDKITQTLLAVSSDDDAAAVFAKGMLERELEPELDFGFSMPAFDAASEAGVSTAVSEARARQEELSGRVKDLEGEVADLERRVREAEDRFQLAQMELERARKQLESARARLERTLSEAAGAESNLKKLMQELR